MEDPSAPSMMYKVIGPRKPKRASKDSWESRIGKWLRKVNGPRMSKREMGHKSPQTM